MHPYASILKVFKWAVFNITFFLKVFLNLLFLTFFKGGVTEEQIKMFAFMRNKLAKTSYMYLVHLRKQHTRTMVGWFACTKSMKLTSMIPYVFLLFLFGFLWWWIFFIFTTVIIHCANKHLKNRETIELYSTTPPTQ